MITYLCKVMGITYDKDTYYYEFDIHCSTHKESVLDYIWNT